MLDGWKVLCEKYQCSLANLPIAWSMAQSKSLNIIFGVRKIKNLHDTLKSLDINIDKNDLELMSEDARMLRKKYRSL